MAWRQKNPKEIPNLVAWFDAAKGITLNGSDVSAWADQSGNGNDLSQGTAADQPAYNSTDANFNGQPSLTFDGGSEHLQSSAFNTPVSQPNTTILAFKLESSPDGEQLMFDGLTSDSQHFRTNGDVFVMNAGIDGVIGSDDLSTHVTLLFFNAGSSNSWFDGTETNPNQSPGTDALDGLTLGTEFNTSNGCNCTIAEVLVYSKDLTTSEKNAIGRYLAGKYGTTWTAITGSDWRAGNKYSK